ncbi:MAG: hypothetical protein DDT33_00579 [Firmicutes bacterium]|nr:hypothetical protein [Bacillota bacterium]
MAKSQQKPWREFLDRGWNPIPIYGITASGACQCGNLDCTQPGKHPKIGWKQYQTTRVSSERAQVWFRDPDTNIGIVTGEISNLVVIDEDLKGAADFLDLPPTLTVLTRDGRRHFYFQHPGYPVKTGPLTTNLDLKGDGGYVVAPPSKHFLGMIYTVLNPNQPMVVLPSNVFPTKTNISASYPILEGTRDVTLTQLAGSLIGRRMHSDQTLALVRAYNSQYCVPPLPDADIMKIVNGISISEARKTEIFDISQFRDLEPPKCIPEGAYYGLLGEILKSVDPYTEASLAAVAVGILVGFGNKIGRTVYTRVEEDRHYTNLYTVIVGDSSRARKGVAWSLVRSLLKDPIRPSEKLIVNFSTAANSWEPRLGGIASGEGIIDMVRDDVTTFDSKIKAHQVVEGSGVDDKRLLIYESEFASVLNKARASSSIIYQVLRTLWDSGEAKNISKLSPVKTTNAHISLIGNITLHELKQSLPTTELSSGTANRILWVWATRSKSLPQGEPIPDALMMTFRERIHACAEFAQNQQNIEMSRSSEAQELWEVLYTTDFDDIPNGALGSTISRPEPQVLRLSMIFALLDQSLTVELAHLVAANSIWKYARDSALYIFGGEIGMPLDNKILNLLEEASSTGATRTELTVKLGEKYRQTDLDAAYQRLRDSGQIIVTKQPPGPKGGRPSELITLRGTKKP